MHTLIKSVTALSDEFSVFVLTYYTLPTVDGASLTFIVRSAVEEIRSGGTLLSSS